jgi:hypothetical protein
MRQTAAMIFFKKIQQMRLIIKPICIDRFLQIEIPAGQAVLPDQLISDQHGQPLAGNAEAA